MLLCWLQGDIAWNPATNRIYGLVDNFDKALLQGSNKDHEVSKTGPVRMCRWQQ